MFSSKRKELPVHVFWHLIFPWFYRIWKQKSYYNLLFLDQLLNWAIRSIIRAGMHLQYKIGSYPNLISYYCIVMMRIFRLVYNMIMHKFYTGQGLHIHLNLTKRHYDLKVETIWEDYGLVEIEGLSGIKNYIFDEKQTKGLISDEQLEQNADEKISMTLKLPEYSSYDADICGSINHIKTFVDSKIRGQSFSINVLSRGEEVNLKYIQAEKLKVNNPFGKTIIGTLISKNSDIKSQQIEAQKVMISDKLNLQCSKGYLRSLILQNSKADIQSDSFECDSIQGEANITAKQRLIVKRWYAQNQQIKVDAKKYQLKIESGTGSAKGTGELILGNDHKGGIKNVSDGVKHIFYTNH